MHHFASPNTPFPGRSQELAEIGALLAEAMPFRFQQGNRHPRKQFLVYLREKQAQRIVLVLDNVEHLLDGVNLLADILAATTGLKSHTGPVAVPAIPSYR